MKMPHVALAELLIKAFQWFMNLFKNVSKDISDQKVASQGMPPMSARTNDYVEVEKTDMTGYNEIAPGWVSKDPYAILPASYFFNKAEAAERIKIDKELKTTLTTVMGHIESVAVNGKFECRFTGIDPTVWKEVKKILEKNNYQVLQNSMTLEWHVRWK